jgi:hypothetical protein
VRFEGWVARTAKSAWVGLRVGVTSEGAVEVQGDQVEVRASHPSKGTMGGAAPAAEASNGERRASPRNQWLLAQVGERNRLLRKVMVCMRLLVKSGACRMASLEYRLALRFFSAG